MNEILASAAIRPLAHPALVRLAEVDQDKVTPGLLGFAVFAALGAAVWFLMRSMNKHFKKVDFEVEPEPGAEPEPAANDRRPEGAERR